MIYWTSENFPISHKRVWISPLSCNLTSHSLGSAQEVSYRLSPYPHLGIVNKVPTWNGSKVPPSHSWHGHQLSCLSLTKSTVCCPPLDAISTERFSSCLPVIFTGLHSSSSSPVPSCRFVPMPHAYTDPGINRANSKWSVHPVLNPLSSLQTDK